MDIYTMAKKYGVTVCDDSYYNPLKRRFMKRYKMYTADGCPWDNNLTYNDVRREIRENKIFFTEIMYAVNKRLTEQH